jgi:hypothetical protein
MSETAILSLAAIFVLVIPVGLVAFIFLWMRERDRHRSTRMQADSDTTILAKRLMSIEERFKPVVDMDAEVARLAQEARSTARDIDILRTQYRDKKAVYDRLLSEVAVFDDKLAFAEMGVYEPHFDFTDSEQYKRSIEAVRQLQKQMITDKTAVICTKEWTVDGNRSAGKTMTNRNIRLTLRAFNNECDAAIANARWNNVNAMEKRIVRAQEQIDKLNDSNAVFITSNYLKLKLQELFLTHEYREKIKLEKDERAEAARLSREEQRLLRDMEQAQEEEDRYARLLAKAKAEAASITGERLDSFAEQIRILEQDLADAHAKVERAQALAQQTRSGYVYIISNIGSFGEDVVKIGLTRRLDPTDRVRELGDASVPFVFDTHAIIYSDDAPSLENALHREFDSVRINAQNYRKEFFRVSIEDVEAAVTRLAPEAPFFRDIEAQDYRETLAKRQAALSQEVAKQQSLLPAEI